MKKRKKASSAESNKNIQPEFETVGKQPDQGGANNTFPEEYEEMRSMNIRIKEQPFVMPKKPGLLDGK